MTNKSGWFKTEEKYELATYFEILERVFQRSREKKMLDKSIIKSVLNF
jgi:hypothetical protein